MQKITTFLTYNDQAEEAAKLYTSLIKNSRIKNVSRYTDAVPGQGGKVMTVQFELAGQEYVAMNGGPSFKFAEGVSLLVSCETQAEIDQLWDRLTANGGKPGADAEAVSRRDQAQQCRPLIGAWAAAEGDRPEPVHASLGTEIVDVPPARVLREQPPLREAVARKLQPGEQCGREDHERDS